MTAATIPEAWRRKHLTPAAQRAVELVASGLLTREIAAALNKSRHTVQNQLEQAMHEGRGSGNRYELVAAIRPAAATRPRLMPTKAFPRWSTRPSWLLSWHV